MLLSCFVKKVTKEDAEREEDSDFLLPLNPPLKTAKHTPQATWFGALFRGFVLLYHFYYCLSGIKTGEHSSPLRI